METIAVGEPVKVHVVFDSQPCVKDNQGRVFPHHKVKPCSFLWQNRQHEIREITYVWREAIGDTLVYHFAVTEGADVFELCFNAATMEWILASVARE
jgi:hypothetical protein